MNTYAEADKRQASPGQTTEDGALLVRAVLDDGASHAAELQRFTLATAGLFRAGNDRPALDHYIELLGGFDMLIRALADVAFVLGVDFSTTPAGDVTLERFVGQLNTLLQETMAAQQRKDWVLIADLLEYELAPHLGQWRELFAALGDTAAR
ncbi:MULTISPECIES: hypothetical protein [Geobacter]|uniref:Uncharacterized protein n=2 Tax=Geobacter TaxID=28231 RepID=A0A0C1TVF2_9BACT|nr:MULTISPECIES: hypothetical protein [Geobacter]ANA41227.1 hypothetical protein A2G06_14280 [Geobacter anodireducens]KIE43368.1 hypothetical protein SE37_12380 [Geobacter soli]MBE2887761.1 hypothetical protein [Geobacter anodireducens]HMN03858.1 hypothetical protein [Geobacter anodireducens]